MSIPSELFYNEYHGHPTVALSHMISGLRNIGLETNWDQKRFKGIIYSAGDSSFDNKYWLRKKGHSEDAVDAVNGYELFLNPPTSLPDIAYHLNANLSKKNI